ncbi:MAG TPA: PAS domain-containing sensor histidine kinase [Usitatibacter sp.]|nr:PAS domain-containing sensor histidine kinase [Usitatibacter sp.]
MAAPTPDVPKLLAMLTEQSPEHVVLLFDPAGHITWANPAAEHVFGYERGELAGLASSALFVPEDVARGLAGHEVEVAIRNGVAEDDRWQRRKDGSRFWAVGAMVALRDAAGEVVALAKVLRDRTDLKGQIETLRNHAIALEQAARRKDAFLSTLAHELRNPLAPLSNAVQLIRMSGAADGDIDYPLKVIERQADLLRRLVDDLLDISRIAAGKVDLERRPLVLQDLLRQCVEDVRTLVAERRHAVDVLVPDEPIRLAADAARLQQVFVNLLTNAAKYTPLGGRIALKATLEGHEAVVKVVDDGVGIPQEMLPRIFELFTQVESSRALARGGLGIGLALVRDLVAMHGGSVQVRSEGIGKGSEFTVRLPLGTGERGAPMRR